MRHSPATIRQLLSDQKASGLSIAKFCHQHDLKPPTFYSWKKKYGQTVTDASVGFCQLNTTREPTPRRLLLPSGLRIDISDMSIAELAELILEINRAHA